MFEWFRKRRRATDVLRITPRDEASELAGVRVDLSDLTPDKVAYLGQVAYFELAVFESLTRAVQTAPQLAAKEGLSEAAGEALHKHQALIAELRKLKVDPAEAMQPFAAQMDQFEKLTLGQDWYETMLGVYLTAGFLDDFFARLCDGLPRGMRDRVAAVLEPDKYSDVIVENLRAAMAEDPRLASRLALWGRRLMGDTQLVARSAVRASDSYDAQNELIDPVFTDLISAHSRRMDGLGLTA